MTSQVRNFHNFSLISVAIERSEVRTTRDGRPYTFAEGVAANFPVPVRVIALHERFEASFERSEYVIGGRLSYEEDSAGNGRLLLYPQRIESQSGTPYRSYVSLTVRAGQDGLSCFSEKSARAWARVRAALGTGKDYTGNARPPLWLTVKAFAEGTNESLPEFLASLKKGELFDVEGTLKCESYRGRQDWNLYARSAQRHESTRQYPTEGQVEGANLIPD